ncbi:hypothetical protein [Pedobacter nyackensis]|uniref:hypothetical protein n=1 Tax=Pedobacter nyackensis TaxID=475255 RepID=UPI0029301D10|nr:hypothetical protein [Pedobacter nyackensis]
MHLGNGTFFIIYICSGLNMYISNQLKKNMNSNINKFNNEGKKDNEWKEFDGDGKLLASGSYLNGKKIGQWETFNTDGTHMCYVDYDVINAKAETDKYKKWYDETYIIIKRDHTDIWQKYKGYVTVPQDNMCEIEVTPYEGNKNQQKEYDTYVQLVRDTYQNVKYKG